MGKKEYYIEFCVNGSKDMYDMQSKVFDTKKEAIKWLRNNFEYINEDYITVFLMSMVYYNEEYYEEGIYEVEQEGEIFPNYNIDDDDEEE